MQQMSLSEAYGVLELEHTASDDDVKRAYRELALVWHPDRFPADPRLQARGEEKLRDLNVAYDVIRTHRQRDTGRSRPSPSSPAAPHARARTQPRSTRRPPASPRAASATAARLPRRSSQPPTAQPPQAVGRDVVLRVVASLLVALFALWSIVAGLLGLFALVLAVAAILTFAFIARVRASYRGR